jgi:hypothetical protein
MPCRNNKPAAMRRSSTDPSFASGWRTNAASKACENSRPMAAPICATSFAGPSRSSRAISEACRLAGTATEDDGIAATARSVAPSPAASSTALVISSTNSGMPSVRSIMSCLVLSGSGQLPVTPSIMAEISRRASRLRASAITCCRPIHGASNSGRCVMISNTPRVLIRSTARPSASRLVGSPQCASSKIISTGLCWASALICAVSASSVRCRCCCEASSSVG